MKKNIILLFSTVLLILTVSCSKDEELSLQYYSAIGMLNIGTSGVTIITDENDTLLVNNPNDVGTDFSNNDRVIATFSLSDKVKPAGINYVIDLNSLQKVKVKSILDLTAEVSDTIGNDELTVNSLWVAKNFITLNFSYYGTGKTHLINMVRKPGSINNDTIELEIRHNKKGDGQTNPYYALVSFNIATLQLEGADSVTLKISAKEYNNRTFSEYFTYKY